MSFSERLKRLPWWAWAPLLGLGMIMMMVGLGWFPLFATAVGWLVATLLRQPSWRPTPSSVTEIVGEPQNVINEAVSSASNQQLCEYWSQSSRELRRAYLPATITSHVQLRQALLDEMQRRDPEAFDRWLSDRPDQLDPRDYLEQREA